MKVRTKLKVCLIISIFLLVLACTAASGRTIYVDADAPDANDGSSWENAYNFLQDALADANSNGDVNEIWVAHGIYRPDETSAVPNGTGDREATFQLVNGVNLKGGYAGFGEPDPNARDIEEYETILSGDINGNDEDVFDPCSLRNDPCRAENSYHVVTGSGTDSNAVLDGFTITGGNANYPWSLNTNGGGMLNKTGSPTVKNCTFRANAAKIGGGGMCNYDSSPTITNCMFSVNCARYGGGISLQYESKMTDCTFTGNYANDGGGGMYNVSASPTLTNCTFSSNSTGGWGGGMYNWDGSPNITNCTFTGNSAYVSGGGVYNYEHGSPVLTRCIFTRNYGGGMESWYVCSPTLDNCIFSGNSAHRSGGGVYNGDQVSTRLKNCTFSGNSIIGNYWVGGMGSFTLTNCIVWGNMAEQLSRDSIMNISYTNVQDGFPGEGNINADPCFVQPGYWDASGVWIQGDYHLLSDSPCIDAGDPNYVPEPNETDLDGKPRVINERIDMGAYEYIPAVSARVRIIPRTINLKSKGKWIAAFIRLPEDYNIVDIEPNSVLLQGQIKPHRYWLFIQHQVAIAIFNRQEVQAILGIGKVELIITGRLTDGTIFEGRDIIIIIDKGVGKMARKWRRMK
jgi:hypothetical protein